MSIFVCASAPTACWASAFKQVARTEAPDVDRLEGNFGEKGGERRGLDEKCIAINQS